MSIEIILSAVNIALVAFSRFIVPTELTGQVFALFAMAVAAAETAVGWQLSSLSIAIKKR